METPIQHIPSNTLADRLEDFLKEDSFQTLPSVLLKDLRRTNGNGENALQHLDITVYALLKSHSRTKGECHPSHEWLAALAACSVSTIQRSLKRLERAGHIQRKSHNKGQIFILTDVAANSKIVKRARISFAPRKREACPPLAQEIQEATKELESFGSEFRKGNALEEYLPPPNEDDAPF